MGGTQAKHADPLAALSGASNSNNKGSCRQVRSDAQFLTALALFGAAEVSPRDLSVLPPDVLAVVSRHFAPQWHCCAKCVERFAESTSLERTLVPPASLSIDCAGVRPLEVEPYHCLIPLFASIQGELAVSKLSISASGFQRNAVDLYKAG